LRASQGITATQCALLHRVPLGTLRMQSLL
jgi:hypothetical protein